MSGNETKIDLLNTLEIVEHVTDGGTILYMMIEDTEQHRAVLEHLVDEPLGAYMAFNKHMLETPGYIEISSLAFAIADCWNATDKVFYMLEELYDEKIKTFSGTMMQRLVDHKGKGTWHECDPKFLHKQILRCWDDLATLIVNEADLQAVQRKAADLANFSMMVADVYAVNKR